MSANTSVIRGPKHVVTKVRAWTRSQTTATVVATLPKGARLLGFSLGGVASDAATTATLSIGSTSTATEYVNAYDVKTAANAKGESVLPLQSGIYGSVLTADTPVYFKYAETGTASTVGGGFVSIRYTTDNILNNDA
jgi:hypothetical protein